MTRITLACTAAAIEGIYSDDLAGWIHETGATVRRASHVEPAPAGGWLADMGPVGGPVLGPFRLRSDALAAESAYITSAVLGADDDK